MSLPAVSLNGFFRDFRDSEHVMYQWGAKPDLLASWLSVHDADCSGWLSKMLVMRGYPQDMPRSSVEMRGWLRSKGFHEPVYNDVLTYARHDGGRLFVAGFDLGGTHRHIFAICAGATMECASSLHGVGSRPAQDFAYQVANGGWCVELPVSLQ